MVINAFNNNKYMEKFVLEKVYKLMYHCSIEVSWSSVPRLEPGQPMRLSYRRAIAILSAMTTYTQAVHEAVIIHKVRSTVEWLLLGLQANLHDIQRCHWNNNHSLHHVTVNDLCTQCSVSYILTKSILWTMLESKLHDMSVVQARPTIMIMLSAHHKINVFLQRTEWMHW